MFEISLSSIESVEIDKLFSLLSKYGDIYFKNKRIYLFSGDIKKQVINKSLIRLLGAGNFMIKDIHPANYDEYPPSLSDWMKQKSYNFEVAKIMLERAEELKDYNAMILRLKEEQSKKEKDGGGVNVETEGVKE